MSDIPRTEAEVNRQKCWSDDLITIDANFAAQLELELNAANQIIRQQQLLEEENLRLKDKIHQLYEGAEEQKQRIKRLEDIINRAHLAFFSDSSDRKVSIAMHRILDEEVRKEANP